MAKERRLIPDGKKVTLEELLPGTIFAFGDDCIAVKSEYRCNNGLIEAFIIDSGEQFWGGAKTAKEQNELMVQPLQIVDVDAVELPCKVGDMVYRKDGAWNVVGFECDRTGSWRVKLERWKDQFWDYHESTKVVFKSFGKTVFLTSEEATAKFAKMGGDGNG